MSRRELAERVGFKESSIVDYENLNPGRRTPLPSHKFVLLLVDEVKRSTDERDVRPVAIEDTIVMYRRLLELRIQADRNSSHAKNVSEALEAELELRANTEQLQAAKAALGMLRLLQEDGTAVSEERVEDKRGEIARLEEARPVLVGAVRRAERALALVPDPDAPPSVASGPRRRPLPESSVGRLGRVQNAPRTIPAPPVAPTAPVAPAVSGDRPVSWRYLIVGAVVVLLLGGFAIFRVTDKDSPAADRADDKPAQTTTAPQTAPEATATTASPSTTAVRRTTPPVTQEPSSEPPASAVLPERKVFVYQSARDVYVGYGRRSVDFDAKPPQQVGSGDTSYDLHTLGSEGNAVILSKNYDDTQLVQTPAGFRPSYENCVALLVRETGQSNIPAHKDDSFCFTTIKNRMVYVTVTQVKPNPSDRETQVVVNATVWENPKILNNDLG
ncbi:helix-turn-helix domain-containing protein [Streptomyces sp. NPDC056529]|uniref:helix-turn-helix domain-containing protein n=1 Tax=Streptomyces sp. NPDC056529 TaxID=3345855 RepID=UPI0036C04B14